MPAVLKSIAMRPAACTASHITATPYERARFAITLTGCSTPVSLLAICTAMSDWPAGN